VYLALYFLLYMLVAFVLRSWLTFRMTGINPLVLPRRDDAYGYVGRAFKFVVGGAAALVLFNAVSPSTLATFGQIEPLDNRTAGTVGWCLLLGSLGWIVIAQWQMGASWRIGIDQANRTELVAHGVFGISRNPIFLGMRINLFGLFLVLPHAASFAVLVAGELLMQIQVRLEEVHLRALHGTDYDTYANRVRRWL
jgi:protein-S-isoprenylcysteine O-methyltransferase Ste14